MLDGSKNWQFDAFKLQNATHGHALSTLGYYLFHTADLIKTFSLDAGALARLVAVRVPGMACVCARCMVMKCCRVASIQMG